MKRSLQQSFVNSVDGSTSAFSYSVRENLQSFSDWDLVFLDTECKESYITTKQVNASRRFLQRNQYLLCNENLVKGIPLDVVLLFNDIQLLHDWPTLEDDLKWNAKHTINCWRLAVLKTVLDMGNNMNDLQCIIHDNPLIRVSIQNYGPVIPLTEMRHLILKENLNGILISMKGHVTKLSTNTHLPQSQVYICKEPCVGATFPQSHTGYIKPIRCKICGQPLIQVSQSMSVDNYQFRLIQLQDNLNIQETNLAYMPRMINVAIREALVKKCLPGDIVVITGILKTRGNFGPKYNFPHIEAISVVNSTENVNHLYSYALNVDNEVIHEMRKYPNIFRLLLHSLSRDIEGQEMIKAALLLTLFGGTKNEHNLHEYLHILLVTDGAVVYDQMLKSCATITPKGMYVDRMNSFSKLVYNVTKDKKENNFAIEAGALVLTNDGCCCINGLQNMSNQYQTLVNSMRRGYEHIMHLNFTCSLSTRTSILATIQPIHGHYDKAKTFHENLNIDQVLLSQFDFIFVTSNYRDQVNDNLVNENIINICTGRNVSTITGQMLSKVLKTECHSKDQSLRHRLAVSKNETINVIPSSYFTIYINYAKQCIRPILTPSATIIIRQYFSNFSKKEIPRDFKHPLKTIVALTEARAKIELRDEATEKDALDAIEIYDDMISHITDLMQSKILNKHVNAISASSNGKLTKQKVNRFMDCVKKQATMLNKSIFTLSELNEIAQNNNIIINDFKSVIAKLNEECYFLMCGAQTYKLNV